MLRPFMRSVGPGIGDQLLLIEALGVVQGLLGCEAKDPVRVSLQAGQVVKKRGLLQLFFCLNGPDHGFPIFKTTRSQILCRFLLPEPGAGCCQGELLCRGKRRQPGLDPADGDLHGPEGFRPEGCDLCIPQHHHGKGRRHHSPHRQRLPIQA